MFDPEPVAQRYSWKICKIHRKAPVRSSRPEVFCRKSVLRNFAKFTRKHLCQSLFFNKVVGLRKKTLAQVFSCKFCEISRNIISSQAADLFYPKSTQRTLEHSQGTRKALQGHLGTQGTLFSRFLIFVMTLEISVIIIDYS